MAPASRKPRKPATPPCLNDVKVVRSAALSRATFFEQMRTAAEVAEPGSEPALLLIDLSSQSPTGERSSPADAAMVGAILGSLSGVIGDAGLVCHLAGLRFAVMVATDGSASPDVVGTAILAAIARITAPQGQRRAGDAVLGMAVWGIHGMTAEELFVAADAAIHRARAADDAASVRVELARIA